MNESIIRPTTLLADQNLYLSTAEREVLRKLAGNVAELASRPVEQQKQQLWMEHNRLNPTRPVVFCDPETSWNEIIPPTTLECTNQIAREWEFHLRREIFWGEEMKDDRVIMPFFDVPHRHNEPDWGVTERIIDTVGEGRTAYTWDPPIQNETDWDKIHTPVIRVDFVTSDRLVGIATDLFGDLLPVRQKTAWWWTLGMTWTLIKLRGLQTFMFDLADKPDFVHRMMTTLRDGTLSLIDALEQAGLLSLNCDGTYIGSGGYGWTDELPGPDYSGHVRTCDLWGFGESQETVGVSPRMFEKFIFPYQLPILEKFGLNYYGCCEPLDKRWHIVERIPRLRRVSVSPWSNRELMAEKLTNQYIYIMKPNPVALAMSDFNEDQVRLALRKDLEVTRNCRVEVIMKDVTTMRNDPQRAKRWVEIALEEANNL
jgi:hypothetical protein